MVDEKYKVSKVTVPHNSNEEQYLSNSTYLLSIFASYITENAKKMDDINSHCI